ncbi:acyl-CoA dehydrogenase [Shouchella clausii]|uniref:Acyl-CoA dehydrogenase n=1 Tax=Shouchella clausii (strain KSM-K16) TaxID=66692 RepID=Q5WB40_SHOC1|nr:MULTISPECIES: acyl-CoA dehydrogenase [Shouchella]ALA53138.1 Butyryl-CoA dehydrogenase [Shouchella clausii]MBU3231318.1 acyl-CoA dehydrogenase [Shouchella clausii]MBU3263679.1 acyl-CoA dehydrogenase [Shouchella clausii]MBU3508070.1 acyl-CoA dehydrogenase [Shouchella clausii]MBU3536829.1 acyl-CoA dehydrogenase [Shouchella clausii]
MNSLLFSEEQQMMQKMVREFSNDVIAPVVEEMEESQLFPRDVLKQMGELGLMGVPVPEEFGGTGMDFVSYIIAVHEVSKVSAAIGLIMSVHTSVGTMPIVAYGTETQKKAYVPKLATAEAIGAFCLTEPNAGSDARALQTRAVKKGEGYVLNGSKVFITNGGEADTYLVFAVTDADKGAKGISCFIVEAGTPGLIVGKKERKLGLAGSTTTEIIFEDCKVPQTQMLGEEGQGLKIALSNLNAGRIGIAAQALGIAEAALEAACTYANERKQFGKKLLNHQGLAFKLADMATETEAAKQLTYAAARLKEAGTPCAKEASMAKLFASRTAMDVATKAVQVFGGYGYMKEYPVERYFRDAKACEIYEGTSEIQKMVIARQFEK